MHHRFTIVIEKEDKFHVAKCLELGITSQGKTYGTALDNIKEAVELYMRENPRATTKQVVIATIEVSKGGSARVVR